MPIEREVFDDLVTLAEAGMASPASFAFIEECRMRHPEWLQPRHKDTSELPRVDPPAQVERESLERTRRLLAQRTWFMFFGIFLCVSPMTFVIRGNEIVFLLRRDKPVIAAALYIAGLLCWAGFVWSSRRLTAAGLAPGAERMTWPAWMFGAIGVFIPAMIMIAGWTGQREPLGALGAVAFIGFAAAMWAGRIPRVR